MRVSTKGRYALAAGIYMAQRHAGGEYMTVIRISETLGLSKIYLEQVFALLKHGGIVTAAKGAQGGYRLARMPGQITALDVFSAVEPAFLEETRGTVPEKAPEIEAALRLSAFQTLDQAVREALRSITLAGLMQEAEKHKGQHALMFYI